MITKQSPPLRYLFDQNYASAEINHIRTAQSHQDTVLDVELYKDHPQHTLLGIYGRCKSPSNDAQAQ